MKIEQIRDLRMAFVIFEPTCSYPRLIWSVLAVSLCTLKIHYSIRSVPAAYIQPTLHVHSRYIAGALHCKLDDYKRKFINRPSSQSKLVNATLLCTVLIYIFKWFGPKTMKLVKNWFASGDLRETRVPQLKDYHNFIPLCL